MNKYNPKEIEPKWQKYWEENKTFEVTEDTKKQKFYSLIEFPYPSGEGLHVGHPRPFTAMDVVSRKKRMEGYNVLYPIGFDAFGLPTENFAIKTGKPPAEVTKKNIANFTRQLKALGYSFDWSRQVDTTDPNYYKWTQWLFLQFYKHGLAYKKNQPINWCPKDKIGLANEEVVNGCCERCGTAVEKRNKEQWMLAITKYADKLLDGLKDVDYIPQARIQQENWIGRSEGAEIQFSISNFQFLNNSQVSISQSDFSHSPPAGGGVRGGRSNSLTVFTTRPDTIYGVTFISVSAELGKSWMENGWKASKEIQKYIEQTLSEQKVLDREEKEKTGVDSGLKAINPVSGEEVPVWITNYVMGGVGTGAIMGVPGHDERDFEFAQKFGLPVRPVVAAHFVEPENPPREGKKTIRRQTVHVILTRPSDGAVLMLQWKANPRKDGSFPRTFLIGGIEDGEAVVEAAKREVAEETGYTNIRFVREVPTRLQTEYFAGHKNENRYADITIVHFEIENEERASIDASENAKHEPVWVDAAKAGTFVNVVDGSFVWNAFAKGGAYAEAGIAVNSGILDGLSTEEAKEKMIAWLEEKGVGKRKVNYKLRDWVFSRQRYWGEPIPLVYCEACAKNQENKKSKNQSEGEQLNPGWIPLPESELPLTLPKVEKYEPTDNGESPLAPMVDWVNTTCPRCGGPAKRETDTMPNWAGSSWYFLRYADPHNDAEFASMKKLEYWMGPDEHKESTPPLVKGGVNWYNGGMEHTVLHLLYSRFWNQFLFDIGLVPTREPYKKRTSHGLILASDGEKMSKSRGNVVNPDEMIERFGADALRTYIMFMGPFDQPVAWDTNGLVGVERFLEKVWNLQERVNSKQTTDNTAVTSKLHQTIKKVSDDIEKMSFNTAVAKMMELVNELSRQEEISPTTYSTLVQLLSPFAPHLSEELWSILGNKESIFTSEWPKYDAELAKESSFTIAVQVNGKVRDEIEIDAEASEDEVKKVVLASEKVQKHLDGKEPKKVIYVKGKLVSLVV